MKITTMPVTLSCYHLQQADNHDRLTAADHPALRCAHIFTTQIAAISAAKQVLRCAEEYYRALCKTWNSEPRPDAARKAFDQESRHACQTEVRISNSATNMSDDNKLQLTLETETRHRWREAKARGTVTPDGATVTEHYLGGPSEWTEWQRHGEGGPYVPAIIVIEVVHCELTLDEPPQAYRTWIKGNR